jgi:hypothetical protein
MISFLFVPGVGIVIILFTAQILKETLHDLWSNLMDFVEKRRKKSSWPLEGNYTWFCRISHLIEWRKAHKEA